MTVHCEGACRVIEQLGEKQEFEIALSRLGFRHEHFELHVMRNAAQPAEENDYSVTVVNVMTQRQQVYRGGPRWEWVQECTRDLATGFFGRAVPRRA
jgi:hypothetical protein